MPLFTAPAPTRVFASQQWYVPFAYAWTNDAVGTGDGKNVLHLAPFPVGVTTSFDRIGTYLSAVAANTNLRIGVWSSVGGLPATLMVDSGSLDSAGGATGDILAATISLTLVPGIYWLGIVWQGAGAAAPTITCYNPASSKPNPYYGIKTSTNAVNAGNLSRYYNVSSISGALANISSGSLGEGNSSTVPTGFLRAL